MEKSQKPIQFQPITSGLGFHPFSDGLPYAPVSKNSGKLQATPHTPQRDLSAGAGAVAAGPSQFAFPSRPVAKSPAPSPQVKTQSPAPRVSVPIATPAPSKLEARIQAIAEPRYGFLYLLKRMIAYSIDTTLNVALLGTGLSFALLNQDIKPDQLMNSGILFISVLFFTLFNWALITAQEIAFGTSVGKRICGLSLNGTTSAIFLRAFFFLPSVGFCGVGLFWGLLDSKKRCWHDLVVNVQPTEIARL